MPTCLSQSSMSESALASRPKRPGRPIRQTVPSRVTLIIGIICKDCVVMACDTQITAGNNKRTDGTKLRPVEFANMSALIAQAGSLTYTNRYIDILSRLAKDKSPNDVVEVGELMNEAMETFRRQLRASNFNCSSEKLDTILARKDTDCRLMLGFCLNRKPYLVSINLFDPNYQECTSHYEADGSGSLLGEYLLREHATPEMKLDFATTIAVYVVEVVKRYDTFCSGKTMVGIAYGPGGFGRQKRSRTRFLEQEAVNDYAELISKAEQTTRAQRNEIIHEEFARHEAAVNEYFKKLEADMPPPTQKDIESMQGDHPDTPDDWADHDPANPSRIS